MKNFVQEGGTLTLTAPYAVASGAGLLVGNIFGVANSAAANGASVEADCFEGVYDLAKTTAEAWTVGAFIYWNDTTKATTTTVASNKKIGVAARAQLAGDTVGRVALIPIVA